MKINPIKCNAVESNCLSLSSKNVDTMALFVSSSVAQWKRAGPITQRSEDQNLALLVVLVFYMKDV